VAWVKAENKMLPLWIQWPQAILILLISCLGSWIAYKQVRIATAKLNLDLYDRRFKVFDAARKFANIGLWDADITQEAIWTRGFFLLRARRKIACLAAFCSVARGDGGIKETQVPQGFLVRYVVASGAKNFESKSDALSS
jgi:hypothetical protein